MSTNTGWALSFDARKWHYFVNGKSLCTRWSMFHFRPMPVDKIGRRCTHCEKKRVGQGLEDVP